MNQTFNIIKKAKIKKEKYNIITFDTHERCQSELAKTGHNFYSFRYDGCKTWNKTFAAIPLNYYIMPMNTLSRGIDFDFILSQSKFGQLQIAKQMQQSLRLPIISVEHTIPTKDLSKQQIDTMKNLRGDINIFITEYAKRQWGYDGYIVENAIDYDTFRPICDEDENKYILSIVNDFVKRDYCCNYYGWKRITENLPIKLLGDTPGLSEPAKNIDDLVNEYNKCAVFFNSSTESQIPTVLIEAMACGKPVVSTATCSIPSFVTHGETGFLSNDEKELRGYLELLLNSPDLRKQMGQKARESIMQRFSYDKFIKNWNRIFDLAYGEN